MYIIPLSDNKLLVLSKLEVFADTNFNVAQMVYFFVDIEQNNVGKGESLVTSSLSFSHNVFKRFLFKGIQKSALCV